MVTPLDRNEGDDIRGAHAGMSSLVLAKIDQLGGFAHPADGSFLDGVAVANDRDDAAIVVGIHFAIQQIDTIDFHGIDDGVDFGFVASLREVGDAFYKRCGHGTRINRVAGGCNFGSRREITELCLDAVIAHGYFAFDRAVERA